MDKTNYTIGIVSEKELCDKRHMSGTIYSMVRQLEIQGYSIEYIPIVYGKAYKFVEHYYKILFNLLHLSCDFTHTIIAAFLLYCYADRKIQKYPIVFFPFSSTFLFFLKKKRGKYISTIPTALFSYFLILISVHLYLIKLVAIA